MSLWQMFYIGTYFALIDSESRSEGRGNQVKHHLIIKTTKLGGIDYVTSYV